MWLIYERGHVLCQLKFSVVKGQIGRLAGLTTAQGNITVTVAWRRAHAVKYLIFHGHSLTTSDEHRRKHDRNEAARTRVVTRDVYMSILFRLLLLSPLAVVVIRPHRCCVRRFHSVSASILLLSSSNPEFLWKLNALKLCAERNETNDSHKSWMGPS